MCEESLLLHGYKYLPKCHEKNCDRFYSKKINDKKAFRVYYYDKFKYNGALDYDFEFEYYEDKEDYAISTYLWALDKSKNYTIEQIEKILIGEQK